MKIVALIFGMTALLLTGSLGPAQAAGPHPKAAIEAGPIWDNTDARGKCSKTCSKYGAWTWQWWTTVQGAMSVCQCRFDGPWTAPLEAGPIWDNTDARGKCPKACSKYGNWTWKWWTTVDGAMSVCQCNFSVGKMNWPQKMLDESRGTCAPNSQCPASTGPGAINCWQCDDEYRDRLDMDSEDLNAWTELKRGTKTLKDGRYIYVLRGWDNKFLIRSYDREDQPRPKCNELYKRARYPGNMRGQTYLHVRHSQLNSGWKPLYSAGEIKIWGGKVAVMNNESGHFKPQDVLVEHAVNTLKAYGVPLAGDLKWGDYKKYSAELTNDECGKLLTE